MIGSMIRCHVTGVYDKIRYSVRTRFIRDLESSLPEIIIMSSARKFLDVNSRKDTPLIHPCFNPRTNLNSALHLQYLLLCYLYCNSLSNMGWFWADPQAKPTPVAPNPLASSDASPPVSTRSCWHISQKQFH